MKRDTLIENDFLCDVCTKCRFYNVQENLLEDIKNEWIEYLSDINYLLYQKLNAIDRDMFVRFFLKRFYKIDTAMDIEKECIDNAFTHVKKLYDESRKDYIEFDFRKKKVLYKKTLT